MKRYWVILLLWFAGAAASAQSLEFLGFDVEMGQPLSLPRCEVGDANTEVIETCYHSIFVKEMSEEVSVDYGAVIYPITSKPDFIKILCLAIIDGNVYEIDIAGNGSDFDNIKPLLITTFGEPDVAVYRAPQGRDKLEWNLKGQEISVEGGGHKEFFISITTPEIRKLEMRWF